MLALLSLLRPAFTAKYAALVLASLAGLALLYTLFGPEPTLHPVLVDAYSPPKLVALANPWPVGTLPTEANVTVKVAIRNTGGQTVLLHKAEASCGCTVPQLSTRQLPPGHSAWVPVAMDTHLKLGDLKKTLWLYSNDPTTPKLEITLAGQVGGAKAKALHHGTAGVKVKDRLVLFKGTCKSCHVSKGVGRTGQALFLADCSMCHGLKGEGGVAPSLKGLNLQSEAGKAYARKVIAEGAPNNPSMPPFAQRLGGPLSEAQIDSLITYLSLQQQLERMATPAKP